MPKYKLSQKINASSIQVIKTLLTMMKGDYSMSELIELLNQNEAEPVFNNSVISKYINTCRFCGFEIPKINNKYYVAEIPFGLDLSTAEVDLIKSLSAFVKDEMSSKCVSVINSFCEKIWHFTNKEIKRVEKTDFVISVEIFERAVARQRMVKLIFKNRETLDCIPLSITKLNNKMFFNIRDKKVRNIDSERLSAIQITGRRFCEQFGGDQVVVFKLRGALAKRYEPRVNETVQLNPDGSIIVTNKNENKEVLFSRLLRYDDKCEIIQPKGYREDMKDVINDMLKNYGEK